MEDKKQKVQKFKKRLQQLLKNEEWEESLVVFDELILVRETPQRWCNRSFVLLQLGKIGLAIEGYKKALKLDPNHEIAHRGLAKAEEILRSLKDEDEEDYAVDSEKETQEASEEQRLIKQFKNFTRQKNWDQALIVLDGLIAIKPTVERLCNQGTILAKQGSLKLALSSYNGALQIDSNSEAAQQGVQRIQKMIYEVREGTKEEPLLAVQLVEDKSNTLLVFIIAAIAFVLIIALIQSMFSNGESVSNNENIEKNIDEGTTSEQYAAEQKAKGFIEYNGKWVTAQQKFSMEQQAKGLVEHDGKWMTTEQKFRMEQEAKGFIEYNGKWVTAQQKFTSEQQAKGLVEYNGKWVTAQQKFISEQRAKGLVEYKGKWMTAQQKLASEQQAKGLVEYKGKWMTAEQKFTREQKAKGLVKFDNKWITKKEWQKKQQLLHETLPKKLRDYHVYLERECKKAAKNKEFREAYLHLKNHVQKLDEFLGVDIKSPVVEKIRSKIPVHKSYIFPLRLFEQQRDVDLAFSPSKLAHLEKDILELQAKFSQTITLRDKTNFNLQTLETNISSTRNEVSRLKSDIKSVITLGSRIKEIKDRLKRHTSGLTKILKKEKQLDVDVAVAEKRLSQLRSKQSLSNKLSDLRRSIREKQESFDNVVGEAKLLRREVDQLERRIRNSNDEQEKQRLRRQVAGLKNQIRDKEIIQEELQDAQTRLRDQEFTIQELENKRQEREDEVLRLREEKSSAKEERQKIKREVSDLGEEKQQKEAQYQKAKNMLPQWKSSLENAEKLLQNQKKQQREQQQNLENYERELQPLNKLKKRKQNILHVVDQFQRWWINLQGNAKVFRTGEHPVKDPLKNMLLALYALHNFSRDHIRVKIHKGYRSLGKAAVYFQ
ncbi:hypothetical protein [Candidatus Uabimicrobium amorphum]|uniref:Chromosome partition protein Smc n=1 Tax=Uabimicrobium amorphum TaxID=2596890 RepID=A0A5S9ISB2_UABAM|nr:hypothetical protein [Candidatus Uabimicrobium amorphum]BBM86512.1 chromosome partition protein Smc [Candidatus Uabimicrobium amorphum]